jgi:hypothetical protein
MKSCSSPRLAAAQGLFQRHQRKRPDDLHRRRRRLGRTESISPTRCRPVRAGAAQHRSRSSPRTAPGPEHIVRMTCYVTSIDEYLAARRDRRRVARDHGPALSGDGAGRGVAAWSKRRQGRDRGDGGGAGVMRVRRSLRPATAAAAGAAARIPSSTLPELIPLRPARAAISRAPQRRGRAAQGRRADALAVVNDHGRWTYADLDDFSAASRGCWSRSRPDPRQPRAAARAQRLHDLFAAWLGVLKAGGVVVATMPLLRPGEIATVIERAQISHAIVDSRFIGDFREASSQTHFVKHIVKYDGDYGKGELETRTASLEAAAARRHRPRRSGADRLHQRHHRRAQGLRPVPPRHPRAVRHLREASSDEARRRLHDQRADRLHLRPRRTLMFPLRFGAAARRSSSRRRRRCSTRSRQARRHPPRHRADRLQGDAVAARARRCALKTLATCLSAGEHLPEATWRAWKERTGIAIVDGIGATEMMHIFISASGDDIRPGATGKAVPGYEATVLDEDGSRWPRASAASRSRARPAAATSMTRARRLCRERLERHRRHLPPRRRRLLSGTSRAATT